MEKELQVAVCGLRGSPQLARWEVSRARLIERGTVLTAVKDAARRCAVACGHP